MINRKEYQLSYKLVLFGLVKLNKLYSKNELLLKQTFLLKIMQNRNVPLGKPSKTDLVYHFEDWVAFKYQGQLENDVVLILTP